MLQTPNVAKTKTYDGVGIGNHEWFAEGAGGRFGLLEEQS